MRLQFLGDQRDAFKWDLLHWICTESNPPYGRLTVIPMLNQDEPASTHGQTSPDKFDCRPAVRDFVRSLRKEPRQIARIRELGSLKGLGEFEVCPYHPDRFLGSGWHRAHYWNYLEGNLLRNSLVFVDPDTGFEPEKKAGEEHLRFGEALDLLNRLDEGSCLVVFQYRPQGQSWNKVLRRISNGVSLGFFKAMIYENTSLVMLAKDLAAGGRISQCLTDYRNSQPEVEEFP